MCENSGTKRDVLHDFILAEYRGLFESTEFLDQQWIQCQRFFTIVTTSVLTAFLAIMEAHQRDMPERSHSQRDG